MLGIAGALAAIAYGGGWVRVWVESEQASMSRGDARRGSLANGRPIPPSGPGYTTYSHLGSTVGRQYLHAAVRDLLLASFAECAEQRPGRVFVVAETGWPSGGDFAPHRTHQNGLSVDIVVPLLDSQGRPSTPACWPWNRFCYGLELDQTGRLDDEHIDFDGLAGLLRELHARAPEHGLRMTRVIIAPEYIPLLLDTPNGRELGDVRRRFLRRESWVRHDDHIHVDFALAPRG